MDSQVHTGGMGQEYVEERAKRHPKGAANSIHYTLLDPIFDRLFGFTVEGSLTQRFALVMKLLAPGQRELDFDPIPDEDHRRRNHGQPLFLNLGGEALDLAFVHQQPPRAAGLVARIPTVLVRTDMTAIEDRLTAGKIDMGIGEVDPAAPDRLDFGAEQLDTRDLVLEKMVEVTGTAILSNHPTLIIHTTTLVMASTTAGSN